MFKRWHIIPVAIIILLMIISFSRISNSQDKNPIIEENYPDNYLEEKHSYYDTEGGYQLKYPAEWSLEDHAFKQEMIRADISFGQEAGLQIRIMEITGTETAFIDGYSNTFQREMSSYWQGKIYEKNRFQGIIGKYQGHKIDLIFNRDDGENWFFREYIWFRKGKAYVFQSGTKLENKEKYLPALDDIAASMIFTD
ncbi:MAG: hypothetical protein JW996_04865 [Candidatus Cloacimonetes bacterium]|nr:hypothetical protein [Candidatus Cloacimonadota bacterium]